MVNVAFRVDASNKTGTGHVMRCLTLANALRKHQAHVRFVCRYLPEHLCRTLTNHGFEVAFCKSDQSGDEFDELAHAHWLGVSQAIDAKDTVRELAGRGWDWIVVDHYALDSRWETTLRGSANNILVIDDLADRIHECDILVDDNLFPDIHSRYVNKVPAHCRLLLGSQYVPLRDEFLQLRKEAQFRTEKVKRILISFGGIDAENYTKLAIAGLINNGVDNLTVDVVVGAQNPFLEQIQYECDRYRLNCYVQTDRMASLMRDADLAIGAAGYTSYEFAAMKLPAILIPTTDIQTVFALEMQKREVAYVATFSRNASIDEVSAVFRKVIRSASLRISMSRACGGVIDGLGSVRIIREMLN